MLGLIFCAMGNFFRCDMVDNGFLGVILVLKEGQELSEGNH